jgi:glycosyltransferase involved in cell wall biosynthesis
MSFSARQIKVGIIANEFLNPKLGRLGGFGWAASQAARVFNTKSDGHFQAVFLSGELNKSNCPVTDSNGTRLILNSGIWYRDIFSLWREKIDILLTIDYRTSYNAVINALPGKPVVVWSRDPKTPDDYKKISTLRIPGLNDVKPAGIPAIRAEMLSRFVKGNLLFRRKVFLANKMKHISLKNTDTYWLPESPLVLPNPDVIDYNKHTARPSSHPRVVYLGRFDPIKRPWIFLELARKFPDVEFIMMGRNNFKCEGGWRPGSIPENVVMTGHLSGDEKYEMLSSAWVLVNTSIHEESPVSVFEALALETPVISYEDWGGIVQNYGVTIGRVPGTGMEGLPELTEAVQLLLTNHDLRKKLGKSGKDFVMREHNDGKFLDAFRVICEKAGL